MVKEKIAERSYYREVIYDSNQWKMLADMRAEAIRVLEALKTCNINGFIHGSLARGDIKRSSDIDIVIIDDVSLTILIWCIESNLSWDHAEIAMATPAKTPKIYIYLTPDEKKVISKSLGKMSSVESDFYRFSGILDLDKARRNIRVPGVNKKLLLIKPTDSGHVEYSILGREFEVARILGVSIHVVEDRVAALLRRDHVGRTGIFLKTYIPRDESIVDKIIELCNKNSLFRRFAQWEGLC